MRILDSTKEVVVVRGVMLERSVIRRYFGGVLEVIRDARFWGAWCLCVCTEEGG